MISCNLPWTKFVINHILKTKYFNFSKPYQICRESRYNSSIIGLEYSRICSTYPGYDSVVFWGWAAAEPGRLDVIKGTMNSAMKKKTLSKSSQAHAGYKKGK